MKIIPQSVKQVSPCDGMEALKRIENAGRTCYRSHDKITDGSAPRFVRTLIQRGHLSPLEFADMAVDQTTSRDVMAELTRHRLASFCVESQRYVTISGDIAFIQPVFYRQGEIASEHWHSFMAVAEESYHRLLDSGQKAEDARKILPNSTATRIIMKANLREWRHILTLRLGKNAYPEMRQLMRMLLTLAREKVPVVFDDLEVTD